MDVDLKRQKTGHTSRFLSPDFDTLTDIDIAADKREGVVGRQYFLRRDGRSR
jgi:hypothetical protein